MSFVIYIVGFLILIGGLICGATIMHLPLHWIVVGAVKATRQRDTAK